MKLSIPTIDFFGLHRAAEKYFCLTYWKSCVPVWALLGRPASTNYIRFLRTLARGNLRATKFTFGNARHPRCKEKKRKCVVQATSESLIQIIVLRFLSLFIGEDFESKNFKRETLRRSLHLSALNSNNSASESVLLVTEEAHEVLTHCWWDETKSASEKNEAYGTEIMKATECRLNEFTLMLLLAIVLLFLSEPSSPRYQRAAKISANFSPHKRCSVSCWVD